MLTESNMNIMVINNATIFLILSIITAVYACMYKISDVYQVVFVFTW